MNRNYYLLVQLLDARHFAYIVIFPTTTSLSLGNFLLIFKMNFTRVNDYRQYRNSNPVRTTPKSVYLLSQYADIDHIRNFTSNILMFNFQLRVLKEILLKHHNYSGHESWLVSYH